MSTLVYLGLGTNLGQRTQNLLEARQSLASYARLLRASSIYQTAPWGFTDQPAFLNQALEVETDLFPLDLLAALKQIELDLGRQPSFHYGPRLIDLDILFYGDIFIDLPGLGIPHPRLAERAFVLVPLAELAPDLRHPLLKLSVRQLLSQVDQTGVSLYK